MKNKSVVIDTRASRGPGAAIAWLALHAPFHFSGQFLDYNDPRIDQPASEFFGNGVD